MHAVEDLVLRKGLLAKEKAGKKDQ
jgi:hypothetical protein